MKNVLLIGSELGKGGAERSISLLSYYLQPYCNVTLCILSGTDRERYYKTCDDVVFVDPPASKSITGKITAWRYRLRKIKTIKKEKNIDVAISFLEGPDYVNVLTRGTEKIILSIRGSKIEDKEIAGLKGMLRKKILIPFLYKRADTIVCVTNALAQELNTHFGIPQDKLTTIYNFYETDLIKNAADEALTPEEAKIFQKPVLICSGRLHMAKEFDKLIRVFASVRQEMETRLVILGDGDMKEALCSLADSLGLSVCDWPQGYKDADIYFMGFRSNVFKFYRHSKVFVLSSSWEGFPNVLAEALICATPVVTTDCHTGPREILNVPVTTQEPIAISERLHVGSLMPLLQYPTSEIINCWKEELLFWLQQPKPDAELFATFTERFSIGHVLHAWQAVIENKQT